jgi:hypothetical protein
MYLLLDRYLNIHSRETTVESLDLALRTAFDMVNKRFDGLFTKTDGTPLGPDYANADHLITYRSETNSFIVFYWDGQATYGYIEIYKLTTRDVEN